MIVKKCTRLKAFKLHTYIYYAEFKKIPGRLNRGLVLVIPFGCCSSISISVVMVKFFFYGRCDDPFLENT